MRRAFCLPISLPTLTCRTFSHPKTVNIPPSRTSVLSQHSTPVRHPKVQTLKASPIATTMESAPNPPIKPSEPVLSPPPTESPTNQSTEAPSSEAPVVQPLSKNQQRKQRRAQHKLENKEQRKIIRKEKRHAKAEKKRTDLQAKMAEAHLAGLDPRSVLPPKPPPKPKSYRAPVAIVLDNDFMKYMDERDFISLCSQLTRCYSQNKRAQYYSHLYMSDWNGRLLERFDTVLLGQYKKWACTRFTETDFISACGEAMVAMQEKTDVDRLPPSLGGEAPIDKEATATEAPPEDFEKISTPKLEETWSDDLALGPEEAQYQNIVYLTSESPYTIEKLEPNTCYVVGGIVDRNREKGLCYKRAKERGVRTGKLPIGDYLKMASRKVLATNHVVEIMLKWLETGNWGAAFMEVIPKRKGGMLKEEEDGGEEGGEADVEDVVVRHDAGMEVVIGETGEDTVMKESHDPA